MIRISEVLCHLLDIYNWSVIGQRQHYLFPVSLIGAYGATELFKNAPTVSNGKWSYCCGVSSGDTGGGVG